MSDETVVIKIKSPEEAINECGCTLELIECKLNELAGEFDSNDSVSETYATLSLLAQNINFIISKLGNITLII